MCAGGFGVHPLSQGSQHSFLLFPALSKQHKVSWSRWRCLVPLVPAQIPDLLLVPCHSEQSSVPQAVLGSAPALGEGHPCLLQGHLMGWEAGIECWVAHLHPGKPLVQFWGWNKSSGFFLNTIHLFSVEIFGFGIQSTWLLSSLRDAASFWEGWVTVPKYAKLILTKGGVRSRREGAQSLRNSLKTFQAGTTTPCRVCIEGLKSNLELKAWLKHLNLLL